MAKAKPKPKQCFVVVEHASGLTRVRGVFEDPFKAKAFAKPIDGRVAGPFWVNDDAPPEPPPEPEKEPSL